jgi:hypothetical protein
LPRSSRRTPNSMQWHAIASSIKDAQEIGMHRDSLDPRPASNALEDILENQWLIQRRPPPFSMLNPALTPSIGRRRLYMMLMLWDVVSSGRRSVVCLKLCLLLTKILQHCGVVLGRPGTVDWGASMCLTLPPSFSSFADPRRPANTPYGCASA